MSARRTASAMLTTSKPVRARGLRVAVLDVADDDVQSGVGALPHQPLPLHLPRTRTHGVGRRSALSRCAWSHRRPAEMAV